mmetsp:Transcript_25552/g.31918  ORF Transcript_25552/g.31918 Transcript_25552/m.31918 type:complete len:114 (+) Transcript_25552:221-562(+)
MFTSITYKELTMEEVGNYEEYLGSKEVQKKSRETEELGISKEARPSAIVCNHQSFLDTYVLICCPLHPSFAAKVEMSRAPIVNKLVEGLMSLYITRGGSTAERNSIVQSIVDR